MSRYWSGFVNGLEPYVPGEQPQMENLVKLNTNEHPLPPSPEVNAALFRELENGDVLRPYPDPCSRTLTATLADYFELEADQVFVGNGSDEVLAHLFNAFFRRDPNLPVLFPDISYSFYPVYCGLYGLNAHKVPLREDFSIDVADYSQPNSGIIIPNPNAPTGILLELEDIETMLRANPDSVVVIDEAYIDFGGRSARGLIDQYPNLLVVQTFSKSRALAGIRVGFALGHRDLIDGLVRVKDSFNSYPIDALAQLAAEASIRDHGYFQRACRYVVDQREALIEALSALGFTVLPSAANFVFARHRSVAAANLMGELRSRGIIVRHFTKPRIDQYLRISVGTEAQHLALLQALGEILEA